MNFSLLLKSLNLFTLFAIKPLSSIVVSQFSYPAECKKIAVIKVPDTGHDAGDHQTLPGETFLLRNITTQNIVFERYVYGCTEPQWFKLFHKSRIQPMKQKKLIRIASLFLFTATYLFALCYGHAFASEKQVQKDHETIYTDGCFIYSAAGERLILVGINKMTDWSSDPSGGLMMDMKDNTSAGDIRFVTSSDYGATGLDGIAWGRRYKMMLKSRETFKNHDPVSSIFVSVHKRNEMERMDQYRYSIDKVTDEIYHS